MTSRTISGNPSSRRSITSRKRAPNPEAHTPKLLVSGGLRSLNVHVGLSLHFQMTASAGTPAEDPAMFLGRVEAEAKRPGFEPTLVLNAPFDSDERRHFARRLTTEHHITSERLKGSVMLGSGQAFRHCPESGDCWLLPEHGVVLVLTDEHGAEAVMGFMRYPSILKARDGQALLATGLGGRWCFRHHIKSPDSRYRELLQMFAAQGYLETIEDEFRR